MVALRSYHPDDAPALLALFRDTIRRVNAQDYTPIQIRAWASDAIHVDQWAARFAGHFVVVAEIEGAIAGFADLESDGHLDLFYVSADHQRRGVGKVLLEAVVTEARRSRVSRLFTEASITARAFFEAAGFSVLAPQTVVVRGVAFRNYRMERDIG